MALTWRAPQARRRCDGVPNNRLSQFSQRRPSRFLSDVRADPWAAVAEVGAAIALIRVGASLGCGVSLQTTKCRTSGEGKKHGQSEMKAVRAKPAQMPSLRRVATLAKNSRDVSTFAAKKRL